MKMILLAVSVAVLFIMGSCAAQNTKELPIANALKIRGEPEEYPWSFHLPVDSEGEWLAPDSCREASNFIYHGMDPRFLPVLKKAVSQTGAGKNEHLSMVSNDELEAVLNAYNEIISEEYGVFYYETFLINVIKKVYDTWSKQRDLSTLGLGRYDEDIFPVFFINSLALKEKNHLLCP